jgi:hypothetical protein
MCDPVAWNRAALSHLSYRGEVLDEASTFVRAYSPGTTATEIPMAPVMIYGSYNSPRIVAQRGGFALFGQGMTPMEEVYLTDSYPNGVMSKIIIGHDFVEEIRESLFRKGFTESVVFPDLDGLAKELRRVFGFS